MADDLRSWMEKVEQIGKLRKIDGADWNLEICAIAQVNLGRKDPPVLLFDNIKGYPKGMRVMTSSSSSASTLGLTFNLTPNYSDRELRSVLTDKLTEWEQAAPKFPPRTVDKGPILENVDSGDKINLLKFPVPKWHELDGGRYIGTGDSVITRDPDVEEINLGTYRTQVQDARTVTIYMEPTRHGRHHISKYHERGQAAPVAISVGHHPVIFRISGMEIDPGLELGTIGAIQGEPVEVVIEEVTGLPIPAASEIVIAGWCRPDKTREEGPFGEWTGYYAGGIHHAPVIEVERVYYRNNPIIMGSATFRAGGGGEYFFRILKTGQLLKELAACGITDVKDVCISEEARRQIVIVSIKQRYPGHARQAALAATMSRTVNPIGRYVIVVDEDIDPSDIHQVLWAMATRSDPATGIDIIRKMPSGGLDPLIRKPAPMNTYYNSRAIIDACKPFDWIDAFPKTVETSPDMLKRVRERWSKALGL